MSNLASLSELLEHVWLGNTINECVINIKDGVAVCKAMDLTSSVYVETSAKTDMEDDTIAFGNIGLLIKYLKTYAGIDAVVTRTDNRLKIQPKGGATMKFLLSEPDLIPTYDSSWEDENRVETLLDMYNAKLVLTNESVSEFVTLIRMFSTKNATFHVAKKGLVTVTGGNDTENQFTATFGKSDFKPCDIELVSSNLLAVLSVLDYTENPVIMLAPGKPALIVCQNSTWVLNGVESTETTNE